MKSSTLVTALTNLTTAMAVAAPIVVFGFLYVLKVQPERDAAEQARRRLAGVHAELNRRHAFIQSQPVVAQLTAVDADHAVASVLDAGSDDVMVTFDARYDQIVRFFGSLRAQAAAVDVYSVDVTPNPGGRMRANVRLRVSRRPVVSIPQPEPRQATIAVAKSPTPRNASRLQRPPPPRREAAPAFAPPVVSSILFSNGRRIARVDGRIVRQGDRLEQGFVRSIERDAVIIADAHGSERRVPLARSARPPAR